MVVVKVSYSGKRPRSHLLETIKIVYNENDKLYSKDAYGST